MHRFPRVGRGMDVLCPLHCTLYCKRNLLRAIMLVTVMIGWVVLIPYGGCGMYVLSNEIRDRTVQSTEYYSLYSSSGSIEHGSSSQRDARYYYLLYITTVGIHGWTDYYTDVAQRYLITTTARII